jgi:hypothetical protein
VKTINPFLTEVVKATKARDPGSKAASGQPTAEEMSRLTFAKLRDPRIDAQELRNRFARLLNRGSSLE